MASARMYIDNDWFTGLFRHRRRNRRRIAVCLHQMAQGVKLTYKANQHVLEDAASNAVVLAMKSLDKFDGRRRDAFNYFTTMIRNEFLRTLRDEIQPEMPARRPHRRTRLKMLPLQFNQTRAGEPRIARKIA